MKSIEVGDLVMKGARTWEVTGVHLGCINQESVLTMRPRDRTSAFTTKGTVDELIVPVDMVEGDVYRRVVEAPNRPRLVGAL
jgi:hypothetical protein